MEKYYDYAQEKYVEGDPMASVYGQFLGFEMLKRRAHKHAEQRRHEDEKKAAEDKTETYEIVEHDGKQYIKELVEESLKKADTWNDRVALYNELFVDYLNRKSYMLKLHYNAGHYVISLKEYKGLVKLISEGD